MFRGDYTLVIMSEKIPNPKELEKEIGDFLSKKFGGEVKIVSSSELPQRAIEESAKEYSHCKDINFDLKPEDLIAYLDRYIVRQDDAKAVLATKVCTHFNRIEHSRSKAGYAGDMVGRIKNNVLMLGPTGVGKTYMVRLIAKKLGVPFVKGDATKFSETGYVGGDVEDLVRDLVREAGGDIELAQYGIIYIDEIDKIASSSRIIGADVSRTGVQRALLKPMEETEVDLKSPSDPISMIQELERFRRTGERDKTSINTKNILFIMSGAFSELGGIIEKRLNKQPIGFGSQIKKTDKGVLFHQMKAEDLIEFGFESEFVGRLPVYAVLDSLAEEDLFQILKNPNNPVILSKKLDFAAYGIQVKFADTVLRRLAQLAHAERTGARGLVGAVEKALIPFEKRLPSIKVKKFPVTEAVLDAPEETLAFLSDPAQRTHAETLYAKLFEQEKRFIQEYITSNKKMFAEKYSLALAPSRIHIVARFYCQHVMELGDAVETIKRYSDDIKKLELYFFKDHDINIVLEEEAVDFIMEGLIDADLQLEDFYRKLSTDLEYGLKLVREKTGKNRFFITREALLNPEHFVAKLLKNDSETKL